MNYTKKTNFSGLGKSEREKLAIILRGTKTTISVAEAANILNLSRVQAAKILSWYTRKGWLSRISCGIYIPVPLTSSTADIILEDPLVIAEKLFSPCYIGGWSAAEHWGMTEQIFRTIVVFTTRKPRNRKPIIHHIQYILHTIKPTLFFGFKTQWRNDVKINISDPTRTIIDMLADPTLGGGLRPTLDILQYYFGSSIKDNEALEKYLQTYNNGAIYKRLGFLLEKYFPHEEKLIQICKNNITKGKTQLGPTLDCKTLITKWQLWVPRNWSDKKTT